MTEVLTKLKNLFSFEGVQSQGHLDPNEFGASVALLYM